MKYKDLLNLGFKRNDCLKGDTVWFDEYGYECFFLEKTLFKAKGFKVKLEWMPDDGKIELIEYRKHNVISRREITGDELKTIIKVLEREGDIETRNINLFA